MFTLIPHPTDEVGPGGGVGGDLIHVGGEVIRRLKLIDEGNCLTERMVSNRRYG